MIELRLKGVDLRGLMPKVDLTRLLATSDLRRFASAADISGLQRAAAASASSKIDFAPLLRSAGAIDMSSIQSNLDRISQLAASQLSQKDVFKSVLDSIDFSSVFAGYDFAKFFATIDLSHLKGLDPPNWPDDVDYDVVQAIVFDDGIPLVWVPHQALVEALLASADRDARVGILLASATAVVDDCRGVLDDVTAIRLAGQLPLARAAVEAYAAGHLESAQALAVVLTETLIADAVDGKYEAVKDKVRFEVDDAPWHEFKIRAALAPVYRFYTAWYRSWGTPAPEALSRHVTVHEAGTDHYNAANALISVMLVTSVIRTVQEMEDQAVGETDEDVA